MSKFRRFLKDTSGTTAIEYGLIGLVVSVGILVGATNVGSSTNSVYELLQDDIRPKL